MSSPSSRSGGALRRLAKELDAWRREHRRARGEVGDGGGDGDVDDVDDEDAGIERLGPVADDDLLTWEAVVNGRGIGAGYDAGRWLLSISIPATYPLHPPQIRFVTPVVHANVALRTGEICLDLLAAAWTPAYGIAQCVRAIRVLLAHPETGSPLNVDIAALLRAGDEVGARALVEYWCAARGYEGR